MKSRPLAQHFFTVGAWTLISRILGFARDIAIAARLGDSAAAEAWIVAFSLPNMFRRFFGEAAFNMAFVPIFTKKLKSESDAKEFAQNVFSWLLIILIVLVAICIYGMPILVMSMASGFAEDERLQMAIDLGRRTFPYILFISISALFSGILNSIGKFSIAAASPVILNIIMLVGIYIAYYWGIATEDALSWSVLLSGIIQLIILLNATRKNGYSFSFQKPVFSPEIKRFFVILAPVIFSGGVMQINLLVGRQIASHTTEGALQYMNLSDRLVQLPLGIIAISVSVVLLPELSRRLKNNDVAGGQTAFNRAAELILFFSIPAAVALLVVPESIVSVLFQRGEFDQIAVENTAMATVLYAAGLPAFALQKVLQPLYFARHDTRRPFNYAVFCMFINAGVALLISPFLGFLSAVLATSISGWILVVLLWFGSRNMGREAAVDKRLLNSIVKILVSSLAMGVVLFVANSILETILQTQGIRYLAMVLLISIGASSYMLLAYKTGLLRNIDLPASFRK